jgi:hypothetical protein
MMTKRTMQIYKVGDKVRFTKQPRWRVGTVVDISITESNTIWYHVHFYTQTNLPHKNGIMRFRARDLGNA